MNATASTAIQSLRERLTPWTAGESRLDAVTTTLLSGALIYIFEVIFVLSFAALVFSGPIASQLPRALGSVLVGDAILLGGSALFSSFAGSISVAQDIPGVVLGVVVAATSAAMPHVSPARQFATVIVLVVLTTLTTGALFLGLGAFKLGGLSRFLPYPVLGGFLAGTGWLLVKGGLALMTDAPFGPQWFRAPALAHWLPGALLGVAMLIGVARIRKPLTLPALLAFGALAFYAIAALQHLSLAQLTAQGWLIGSIRSDSISRFPLNGDTLAQVNWPLVLAQTPNLAPVAVISIVALLLNSSGLELVAKRDIDLNRELVVAGAANLVAGLFGGLVGYPAISLSTLNVRMSGGKRLAGLFAAICLLATTVFGAAALLYIPKLVLGSILVYLGGGLLVEWVYDAWFTFPKIDFAIILSVTAVIIFGGFLNGIILGIIIAIILFVVSYSRISVVKFALPGAKYRSRVTRSPQQRQTLEAEADQLYIVKLQGFIFFGTANTIVDSVRAQARRASVPIHYVLLDFASVSGLDSTGLLSFKRLWQWSQEQRITLALTGLSTPLRARFAHAGFQEQQGDVRFFTDLDHGVEWCEDTIIAEASAAGEARSGDLLADLRAMGSDHAAVEELIASLHRQEYPAGAYLARQGDEPDAIYFVEAGQVSAQLEDPEQAPVRLEAMGGGRAIGELGFLLGIRRTATIVVDKPSVIYSLSRDDLNDLERSHPEAAHQFYRILAYLLGERVTHTTQVIAALER